jgi:hypothetical protein
MLIGKYLQIYNNYEKAAVRLACGSEKGKKEGVDTGGTLVQGIPRILIPSKTTASGSLPTPNPLLHAYCPLLPLLTIYSPMLLPPVCACLRV